jgi:hypothetical protein
MMLLPWFMRLPACMAALASCWLIAGAGEAHAQTCVDSDGDGYVYCTGCSLPVGKACGECSSNPGIHPGAPDPYCDFVDQDCDGYDGPRPTGHVSGLQVLANKSDLLWDAFPGASVYEIARGNLNALRSTVGNFASSLLNCIENRSVDTLATDAGTPSSGSGIYYLVRYQDACNNRSTYDSGSPSQIGSRDAEIDGTILDSCTASTLCVGENPATDRCETDLDCVFPDFCDLSYCIPFSCYCAGQGWRCIHAPCYGLCHQ